MNGVKTLWNNFNKKVILQVVNPKVEVTEPLRENPNYKNKSKWGWTSFSIDYFKQINYI